MNDEELYDFSDDGTSENDHADGYYFSNPDPYAKCEPLSPEYHNYNFWRTGDGHIRVKNLSACWLPDFKLQKVIGGTIYSQTN